MPLENSVDMMEIENQPAQPRNTTQALQLFQTLGGNREHVTYMILDPSGAIHLEASPRVPKSRARRVFNKTTMRVREREQEKKHGEVLGAASVKKSVSAAALKRACLKKLHITEEMWDQARKQAAKECDESVASGGMPGIIFDKRRYLRIIDGVEVRRVISNKKIKPAKRHDAMELVDDDVQENGSGDIEMEN